MVMGQSNNLKVVSNRDRGNSGYSGHLRRYGDLKYCFRSPHLSLACCIKIVQAGRAGRRKRNVGIMPFKNITVAELNV